MPGVSRTRCETCRVPDEPLVDLRLDLKFLTLRLRVTQAELTLLGAVAVVTVWLSTRHLSKREVRRIAAIQAPHRTS